MAALLDDQHVVQRVLDHIDRKTTDTGTEIWREPVEHYTSPRRLAAELDLLRRLPVPFCPTAALPDVGSYVARIAAGTPLLVVRDADGTVRAFRNACRHRGMRLADGAGCARAFVCGYHGWTYRLDGSLQHIPHAAGFPGIDRTKHGLVPVTAIESHGLVFVTQVESPIASHALDAMADVPDLIKPDQRIFATHEGIAKINWKLSMEGNLEGYHIKPTHKETFFPYGFDNLTLIETFGRNSRVTFPFRRIEKLRDVPSEQRHVEGLLTYVYHLFPNVIIAVLSNHTTMSVLEPTAPDETRFVTYRLTNKSQQAKKGQRASTATDDATDDATDEKALRDAQFVSDTGGKEDAAVVRAIQTGIASGANEHFTYGHFERAIVHFHQSLHALIG